MRKAATIAFTLAVLVACESGTGPSPMPAPATVEAVGGNGQTAPAGTLLPSPVVVKVTDDEGGSTAGHVVVFRVISGGGTVQGGSQRTAADGTASERWTLGSAAGEQRLEARVLGEDGNPLAADTLTATAQAGPAAEMAAVGGDGQGGTPGQPLPDPLAVRVRDAFGNPVPGFTVQWQVTAGGGSVSPATSATDANGVARTEWTLGLLGGAGTVRATGAGVPAVTFSSTSSVTPADQVEIVSGGGQSAVVGTELANPVVAEARDAQGQPLPGVFVVFRVISGGGSVRTGVVRTGPDGRASDRWTMGVFAGTQQMEARVVDANGATLAADTVAGTAIPAAPSQIAVVSGEGQSALPGQPLPQPLAVRLRDPYGNVVPGWTVQWEVLTGGGAVQPPASTTDANGVAQAQWTMGSAGGTVRASAQGVAPVTFSAAVTPLPGAITVFGGNGQQAPAGAAPQNPLVVRVVTGDGQPVPGATVTWQVTAGGGALRSVQAVTDASGLSSAEWVLGPRIGAVHAVRASVAGVATPVTFTATATLPASLVLVRVSGDAQTGRVGTTLPQRLVVEVRLADGRPLEGAPVQWTPSTGTLSPGPPATDAAGRASRQWTLGAGPGAQTVTVQVGGSSTVFTATVLSATIVRLSEESLTLPAGEVDTVTMSVNGAGAGEAFGIWTSLDSTIAAVYPFGGQRRGAVILGRRAGTTRIVGRAEDGADTLTVTVTPIPAPFVTFAAGTTTACALTGPTGGPRLYCWGSQVPVPHLPPRVDYLAPVQIPNTRNFDWVTVGEGANTLCAGTAGGRAFCWREGTEEPQPKAVPGGHSWQRIEYGFVHGCGITVDGSAWCFGNARYGKLGHGSTEGATGTPVPVAGGRQWSDVTTGTHHSCGLTTAGAAYCWGAAGTLGISNPALSSSVPVAVAGGHTFTKIDAGHGTTCALDAANVAWCWGGAYSAVPEQVPGIGLTDIEVAPARPFSTDARICGVGTDGRSYCWIPSATVRGPGGTASSTLVYRHVEPFQGSACGITTGSRIYCWGENSMGQLGQGDRVDRSSPVRVVSQP